MSVLTADLGRLFRERIVPNLRAMWNDRSPLVWLVALVIGVAGAYGILAFREGIGAVQWLWLGDGHEHLTASLAGAIPWWLVIAGPVCGGVAVGLLLQYVMPTRRAHAVADVIEAEALGGARISPRTGFWSAVISAISLGSGASAGREGPAVHLGAAIASMLCRKFGFVTATRRVILGCGAAAAVSASFNAPIAGVLFAHEVVLAHYAPSAFIPLVISSVSAAVFTRLHLGDFPAFIIPSYQITSYWEFPAFALLGLTCGLVAACFQFSVMTADWTARQIRCPLWVRPVVGGVLVGAIAIYVPEVLGVGYEATNLALHQKLSLGLLFTLLFAKTAATAVTLASRFGGGVFSPSIYLGAMTGGAFGVIAASVFPEAASSQGLYAILGMGAVAGAVLGAPISSVLVVVELTGGFDMTMAVLVAVSISWGVMQAVHGQSFFHWQLSTRGVLLQGGPHRRVMRTLTVASFMTPLTPEEEAEPPALEPDRPTLAPGTTLGTALRTFNARGYSRIAVVDPDEEMRIVGWADYVEALNTFNTALIEAEQEEHR